MALEFLDSADHYNTTDQISLKWTQNIIGGTHSVANGRNGRGFTSGSGVAKTLTHQTDRVSGFAFNCPGTGPNGNLYRVAHVNRVLASVRIEGDQTLSIYAGNNFTLIQNSGTLTHPISIQSNVWYFIEIKTSISGTTPVNATVTVKLNGTQILTGSGSTGLNLTDLLLGAVEGPTTNSVIIGGLSDNTIYDDVYMAAINGSGSINDFAGDVKLGVVFPDGDVTTNWTPSRVGTHFDLVNETFPDDDTSYIKDLNPGDKDNFNWQNIAAFTGDIIGIHYGAYARKDDEGTRSFKQSTHGTMNGPEIFPGDSYFWHFFAMDQNPDTGSPWTQAEFNAQTFGVETVS